MTGELVVRGSELVPVAEEVLTVDEMRDRLMAHLEAHPEIPVGAVLEVWPDGRMKGWLGGLFGPRGYVTTIEHPFNTSRSYQ